MRIKLSNGLYVDPCDPCFLYDTPIEPQSEEIVLSEEERQMLELRNEIDRLRSEITAMQCRDAHWG